MPLSDSSATYMRVVRPEPSPAVLLAGSAAGVSEVSRFSCMKLPDVSGVYDYAGPTRDSRYRPRRFAFHQVKGVGVLIASFRISIPSPPAPLFTLRRTPHDVQRKTRGRVVRYSFLVGLLHSLLHAGLSRRTDSAIMHSLTRPLAITGLNASSDHPIFSLEVATTASLLGLMIHMILSMPSAEASIVASATGMPSRDIRTDACPFASTHATVMPVQKCEAKAEMNFATCSRPETGARAAVRTTPPPSE